MPLVYALVAKSSPNEIRYIGKTAYPSPTRRHNDHLKEAKKSKNTNYKFNWIRKVLRTNDEVLVVVLESNLTEEEAFHREIYYIAHYKKLGHRLTNATLGGEGTLGLKHTPETKTKISLANMGKTNSLGHRQTLEHRVKLSEFHIGKTVTPETRLKISLYQKGRPKSLESIAKRVATKKANRETKNTPVS